MINKIRNVTFFTASISAIVLLVAMVFYTASIEASQVNQSVIVIFGVAAFLLIMVALNMVFNCKYYLIPKSERKSRG